MGSIQAKIERTLFSWLVYGSMTLGHSNWTICSLLNWFRSKKNPPFYPASHNKPVLITPRKRKERAESEKKEPPKVNETQGFLTPGHSNPTIYSLLNWFCSKKCPPFYPASHNKPVLITPRKRREGRSRGWKLEKGIFHSMIVTSPVLKRILL